MASYVDLGFLNAINSVQPPNYIGNFAQSFALMSQMPWSAREQRKRQLEDLEIGMKTAQFQADMAERARRAQVEEMMLPYQMQLLQARAQKYMGGESAAPTGSDIYDELVTSFGVFDEEGLDDNLGDGLPTDQDPLPMGEQIPVLQEPAVNVPQSNPFAPSIPLLLQ